jgi:hypothetical protein
MNSKYSTKSKEYHKEYYNRYKDMLMYRRAQAKERKLTEDVIAWKIMMESNPHAFYPFYEPSGVLTIPDISSCDSFSNE